MLTQFKENKFAFGLFGGHEEFSDIFPSDIDIWIASKEQCPAKQVFCRLSEEYGWKIVKPPVSPRLSGPLEGKYYLIHNETSSVLQIDFWSCVHWRGLPLFDESVYLDQIQIHSQEFHVLHHSLNTTITLLKDILYKRKLTQKSLSRVQGCDPDQKGRLRALITQRFGVSIEKSLWASIEITNLNLSLLRKKLIFRLLWNNLICHPFRQLGYWGRYIFRLIHSYVFASYGLVIVFIGTDGAGKSTLIENLMQSHFATLLFEKKYRFHTKLSLFPPIHFFRFFKNTPAKEQSLYKASSARNLTPLPILQSMIYPFYYGLELFIGNIWISIQKKRAGAMLIFDRYFYEYLIQDEFSRCPRWWIHFWIRIIPKPDVTICLTASPEVIHERKPELPLHIIQEQMLRYENLCSSLPNGHIVNTSGNIDNSLSQIYRFITQRISLLSKINI